MNKLPVELLPLVIEHLNLKDRQTCSLVSKSFYTATVPILWRFYSEDIKAPPLKVINRMKTSQHPLTIYLRRLQLWSSDWRDSDLVMLMPHLGLLEELRFGLTSHLSTTIIQQLAQHCTNLKVLRLWDIELTTDLMDALAHHCHQLEELELGCCPDDHATRLFTPFIQLDDRCALKKLVIHNGASGRHWKQDTLMDLTHFAQLTHLTFLEDAADLVQLFVSLVSRQMWPLLEHLCIDHLGDIGDTQLIPLIQARPRLRSLSLGNSHCLTDATLHAMATYLHKLAYLDLDSIKGITAPAIRRFVQRCAHLEFIDIYQCSFSTSDFPEARGNGLDLDESDQFGNPMVMSLDFNTINKIRRGAS